MAGSPAEFLTTSRPSVPITDRHSPEVSAPNDDTPRAGPSLDGISRPPRFRSQAFSTSQRFTSALEFAAIFHAAAVRVTSFRAFPSQRSRTSLEAASSPAVIHQGPRRSFLRLITNGFPDAHGCPRLPGSPADYGLPFHEAETPLPGHPEHWTLNRPFTQLHPLRSFFPPASPFTPTRVAPSSRPILSWLSALLECVPPNLGTSVPPRPESLSTQSRPTARPKANRRPTPRDPEDPHGRNRTFTP